MVLLDLHKLLCSAVVFCFLMKKWQVRVFPSGGVQLQLNSCSDVQPQHTCRVRCPPCKMYPTAHQRKDSICTCTQWPHTLHFTMNWLLNVAVVFGPSAMFTFIDFTSLVYQEAKCPSTSSGSTFAIISHAKTRAAHLFVLYRTTDNRIIISFLAVWID